jgi:hypothetical protein
MKRGEIVGTVVTRPIIGDLYEVMAALDTLDSRGDLVEWTEDRTLADGRIVVNARYVDRTPAPTRRRVRVRWVVAGSVAGAGVLTGVGYAMYLAVVAVLPLLPGIVALGLLVALAWFLLGQRAACPGIHCPGCRCHR